MSSILVIEDEDRIASFVAKGLRAEGYTVTIVADGITGQDYALTGDFDLVVLDIGLPLLDGFSILDRLAAERPALPVIVLTARDSVTDTVAALEGGAADYMSKPFRFDELVARVRLRLRAVHAGGPSDDVLEVAGVRLDLRRRVASVRGTEVELSSREFTLAEVFLRNPDHALSREQLLSQVWGYDFDPGSNVVDVYVGYLRKKLGADLIRTVRGVGYRFGA
ncbi:response regulator transcription factor [Mumia zhuanghuii]|uniref:Response regulator transcription factor n=2 Tax=Mumia TaxID=1546255 RepID=A0ABW1QSY3_9ACTN|nr:MULTISPECIES: response regulator transcription factor [Mumia]KAA1420586.1 response regulator transcription factor [Mumia zhuanghuii]